jgi:acyl-CoA thioesterase FadM
MKSCQTTKVLGFGDADPAGVVFYPRLFALAHEAVEELIRQSPVGWESWFASPRHAAPIRHAEAEFFRPMPAGATLSVHAMAEKTGATSVVFAVEFRDGSGRCAARVRTVHVLVDRVTGRPVPLPPEWRAAFGLPG